MGPFVLKTKQRLRVFQFRDIARPGFICELGMRRMVSSLIKTKGRPVHWACFGLINWEKDAPVQFEYCYFSIRNQPVQKLCSSREEGRVLIPGKGEFLNNKCFDFAF